MFYNYQKMRFCKGSNLAISLGMDAVIPPKGNRKKQLSFDRYLYRYRHLVENRFFGFQTLAEYCDVLCKETGFVCGGNRNLDYCDVA